MPATPCTFLHLGEVGEVAPGTEGGQVTAGVGHQETLSTRWWPSQGHRALRGECFWGAETGRARLCPHRWTLLHGIS